MEKELELHKLAQSCRFAIKDDELEYINDNFAILNKQIEVLDKINTDDVKEMIYPFETPMVYLREDVVEKVLPRKKVLENAKVHDDKYIIVATKVVE